MSRHSSVDMYLYVCMSVRLFIRLYVCLSLYLSDGMPACMCLCDGRTDLQTQGWMDKHIRRLDRRPARQKYVQTDVNTYIQKDKQTYIHTDRQTDGDIHRDRQTDLYLYSHTLIRSFIQLRNCNLEIRTKK